MTKVMNGPTFQLKWIPVGLVWQGGATDTRDGSERAIELELIQNPAEAGEAGEAGAGVQLGEV